VQPLLCASTSWRQLGCFGWNGRTWLTSTLTNYGSHPPTPCLPSTTINAFHAPYLLYSLGTGVNLMYFYLFVYNIKGGRGKKFNPLQYINLILHFNLLEGWVSLFPRLYVLECVLVESVDGCAFASTTIHVCYVGINQLD